MNWGRMDIWEASDDDEEVVPAPSFDDPVEEETEDLPDGGISDVDGIVRIWVEDNRLVKVVVSPLWYTKLERRRNASLEHVFSVVLAMAHVGVAAPRSVKLTDDDLQLTPEFKRSLPVLSEDVFAKLAEHQALLDARFERMLREQDRTSRPSRSFEGREKGITVRLDGRGCARSVEFDPKWLDEAQAGQISAGVLRAANEAYARFEPDPGDDLAGLVAREYDYLRKVMSTIATPKEFR